MSRFTTHNYEFTGLLFKIQYQLDALENISTDRKSPETDI